MTQLRILFELNENESTLAPLLIVLGSIILLLMIILICRYNLTHQIYCTCWIILTIFSLCPLSLITIGILIYTDKINLNNFPNQINNILNN